MKQHGPTRTTLVILACNGCAFHWSQEVRPGASIHRCTHPEARRLRTGTIDGVYIGMTGEAPEWCPCLELGRQPCTCGAEDVSDRLHVSDCQAAVLGGEG